MLTITEQKHPVLDMGGGVKLELHEFICQAPHSGKKVYIQSGLHGGETSQWVLYQLYPYLQEHLCQGEIHIIPYANPMAWMQRSYLSTYGKFSQLDGKDYNRCFSEKLSGDTTSLLCKKLLELATRADFVLDLHTSKQSNPFAIFTQKSYLPEIKSLGLPYNQYSDDAAIPSLRGTFNAALDRAGIPNLTIECGSHDDYQPQQIKQVSDGIINLLSSWNMLDSQAHPQPQGGYFSRRTKIFSPCGGLVKFLVQVGKSYPQGTHIAEVYAADKLDAPLIITLPEDGILHTIQRGNILWQGDVLAEYIPITDLRDL